MILGPVLGRTDLSPIFIFELPDFFVATGFLSLLSRRTPRGSCNNTLPGRVLRGFFNSKCFLEGGLVGVSVRTGVLRRVFRGGGGFREGA